MSFSTRFLLLTLVLLMPLVGVQSALPVAVDGQPLPSLAPMLQRVMPAVVNISTEGPLQQRQHPLLSDPFFRRFFDVPQQNPRQAYSLGSGVIVDASNGYIITNHHVIEYASKIKVRLQDGRNVEAQLVGADPDTDVAVIQVLAKDLVAIELADSDQALVGDFVVAIGNPFGLGQTVTSGIVSALGRSGLGIEDYEDFIQTDASINPGNSGGALVNLHGKLVGINTAIIAPNGGNVGIGFAIPSNMARDIMNQLVTHGEVRRGLLGVALQNLTQELAEAFGVQSTSGAVIVKVKTDSPADEAGLQPGDIVVGINGETINSANDAHTRLGLLTVDEAVEIEILRDGRKLVLRTQLAQRAPSSVASETLHPRFVGAQLMEIPNTSPLYGRIQGVQVGGVVAGSLAERGGFLEGDIITSVNRIRTRNLSELAQVLSRAPGGKLLFRVQRGRSALFVLIR